MIKNKRLKKEVEQRELELFRQGQLVIEDEVKEDASAPAAPPPEEKKVRSCFSFVFCLSVFFASSFRSSGTSRAGGPQGPNRQLASVGSA